MIDPTPPHSVHTTNFPALLEQLGISILVSTYQAGKLIVLRNDGGVLNTHFRIFQKPMGMAAQANKLVIGTAYQIWELRNVPASAPKVAPQNKHDACFLPRRSHITGDIDIHEMTFVGEDLWFVNTRFSCLCTVDPDHSFVPRWRPPFVSAYDLSDRCHLNGLATVDDRLKYVTALGETDTAGGWRANKASGGILMDITQDQVICRGLSMPHSPRWYRDQLWVLESGKGGLAKVDPRTGQVTMVAELPGFTRGLDFWGPLAFVGLSQVRETAVFSGLPITERITERICGVWVVNIETGQIVAFLRFEQGVREIFAVQVLPGIKFPEVLGDPRFADGDSEKLMGSAYVLPDEALKQVQITQPDAQPDTATPPDPLTLPPDQIPVPHLKSFAVVLTLGDLERSGLEVFRKTLQSIEDSLAYFREQYPHIDQVSTEIVIVDPSSNDSLADQLQHEIQGKTHIKVIRQPGIGSAAARNLGVRSTEAQGIFFGDLDTLYLAPHILTGWLCLNQPLSPAHQATYRLPGNYPGAIKTLIQISEDGILPQWRQHLRNSLTSNLCIRREAYAFLEGFSEQEMVEQSETQLGDQAFTQWLTSFFNIIWHPKESIAYLRRPGNSLDRQIARFQSPPGSPQDRLSPEEQQRLPQIKQLAQTHLGYLQDKFRTSYNLEHLLSKGTEAYNRKDLRESERLFRRCLDLDPTFIRATYNLGVVYSDLENLPEATRLMQQVIDTLLANPQITDPALADAYNQMGVICSHQTLRQEAIQWHRKAIERRPQFALAHFNLGIALLGSGQLKAGFKEYEYRWQLPTFTPLQCPHPQWDGRDISDRSILIHTEQGGGDAMQFIRYIPLVAQRCRRVILTCTENLVELFQTVPSIDTIYTPGQIPLSEFQTYAPLMSLPHLLGTTLETIPAQVPYLKVPPRPQPKPWDRWQREAPDQPRPLRVGIAWAGSPTYVNDHNRSAHIRDLIPMLQVPQVKFYSLQKGPPVEQLRQLPEEITVVDWDRAQANYSDTAAAIECLDLVISVDTSVAHLTGALGKPLWILLCYACDWRWLSDRDDSPWYPTARLFRQTAPKDWPSVMDQVCPALAAEAHRLAQGS